ncbi:hypothetical protein BY996DRAFT_6578271 [Phakopsora pachyrhizi]|nr:hypothetical protein BY996DRAFT_6578271 [Phakopsora pachyrhizi]
MSQRTYVGSTPDPPQCFQQHNGQLKGGAVRTKYHWPWEMELICFRFPSKLPMKSLKGQQAELLRQVNEAKARVAFATRQKQQAS